MRHMKLKYQILEKLPFLLPIFWCVRILSFIFFKGKKVKQTQQKISNVDQQDIDVMKEIFEKSGL